MKKTLALTALLTSTLLNAHNTYHTSPFNHPMFGGEFLQEFERQFQNFDRQMDILQHSVYTMDTSSQQYFDKEANRYVVEIKSSGIDKNNFHISIHLGMLIIKAGQISQGDNESSSSHFSHMLSMPIDGDIENITAAFQEGVLRVFIPKLDQPKPQVREITIQ